MIFRNEQLPLGAQSTINEFGTLASNTTLVNNNFKPTSREILSVPLIVAAAASSQYVFQAPWTCQVVGIRVNWTVQSTGAANLSVLRVTADAVAPAAANGTTLILLSNAVVSLQGTANSRQNIALSAAAGNPLVLNPGDQIAIFESAATTGLAGAYVQVEIAQIG